MAGIALLSGCTVGPNFEPPAPTMPDAFARVTGPQPPADVESRTVNAPASNLSRWWEQFNDPTLTSLIDRAAASNLSVQQAEASIRQARFSRDISSAALSPSVDAGASASRSRSGGSAGARTGNSFREGFDASWEIDIFGGIRRGVEAADAQIVASIEDRRDVLVSLAAEVATNYFDLRATQYEIAIAQRNLKLQQDTADLTKRRYEAGYVSKLDQANANSQVYGTMSRIPILEAQELQIIHTLGVLLGSEPNSLIAELSAPGSEWRQPITPPEVPVGLPSELLLRRPDIRRAQAQLHAAIAQIGAAEADLFPRFSLTGSFGLAGSKVGALTNAADRFWSVGPAVSWPVFDGGRIGANIEVQKTVADQVYATYRGAVLGALRDVEDALIAYEKEQQRRVALRETVAADRESVQLSTDLYTAGRKDFLNVLTAQRSLLDSEDALAQSDRTVATNLVQLYKALGGGWTDPAQAQEAKPAGR